MSKTALVITTQAEVKILDIEHNTLSQLQNAVDGLIQPIDLDANAVMWVNEEGLFRNDLEANDIATSLYAQMYQITNPIIGDVVFTGGADDNGDTLGLTEEYVKALTEMADNYRKVMSQFNLMIAK